MTYYSSMGHADILNRILDGHEKDRGDINDPSNYWRKRGIQCGLLKLREDGTVERNPDHPQAND